MLRPIVCYSAILLFAAPVSLGATQRLASHLLPESVVLYAETTSIGDSLSSLLDHPQRQKIESLPQYQEWLASKERGQLLLGVRFMEVQLGVPWRRAIEKLGAGGAYFALDGVSGGLAILVKADDAGFLQKTQKRLLNLARTDAANNGDPVPFQSSNYHGVRVFRADQVRFAVVGPWLIVTNSAALSKSVIDRFRGDSERSLADNHRFRSAHASRAATALAWAYADLATLRTAGVAEPLLGGSSRDPGAELLLGGVLNTLHKAPSATAQLMSAGNSIDLAVTLPHDPDWTPRQRQFFFGPEQQGAAPTELGLPETVLEVRAYREISQMWLHGPDLFNEAVNAKLAKANSDLSTLFGGRPFAEEILGSLDGGIRLVVVREPSGDRSAQKGILRLPGFAAVARLKNSARAQRPLRIAFQTAIGFANLTGAAEGRPPLELETQRNNGMTLLVASAGDDDLAAGRDDTNMAGAGMMHDLSPTVGFVGDAVVLASTRSLAQQLLERLSANGGTSPQPNQQSKVANSALRITAAPLRATLVENRERLISNNMLEKGHSRAAAVREVDALLTLLECFAKADATLEVSSNQLQLSVALLASEE